MKAIIFSEGVSQYAEDGEQVTHVILLSDNVPAKDAICKQYNKFIDRKLSIYSKRLKLKGVKVKNKEGYYTERVRRGFEKFKKEKKIEFPAWIEKEYKGKSVPFEEI